MQAQYNVNARESQCSKNVIGADNGFSVREKRVQSRAGTRVRG